jgi:hypothetical protein
LDFYLVFSGSGFRHFVFSGVQVLGVYFFRFSRTGFGLYFGFRWI